MLKITGLFLGVLIFATSNSYAALPPMKVGVFSLAKALTTVKQGKKAKATLKKEWDKKQASLKKREAKIQAAVEDFKKQSLLMDNKARMEKEREIRQKVVQLQQEGAKAQMSFQKRDQELSNPIVARLKTMVSDISKKRGYTLVLNGEDNTVLYFNAKDDLTKEVIALYDKKYK